MGYHRGFFGIGYVTAIPSGTNPTPVNIAIVRGAEVTFASTEKPLMGNKLFPVDSATTSASVTGKITTSDFDARLVGMVIPGTSTTTGQTKAATHSAVVPNTPFAVTVTNSATWVTDLGVVNLTNGVVMTRVAGGAEATNKYSVAAGVYTFHTDDAGDSVAISYTYTGTTGQTLTSTNQTSGATTGYALRLFDPPGGSHENGLLFPAVKFSNLSLGMKIDDWTETSIDFTAFEDATGNVFYTYGNE